MILKKNLIKFISKTQNDVLEQSDINGEHNVIEDSSINASETLRVKNILKIRTLLPLEPSLYSPIHLLGEKKTN